MQVIGKNELKRYTGQNYPCLTLSEKIYTRHVVAIGLSLCVEKLWPSRQDVVNSLMLPQMTQAWLQCCLSLEIV